MGQLSVIKELKEIANPTGQEVIRLMLEAQRLILLKKCENSLCQVFINKDGKWILRFAKMDNTSMQTVWSKDSPVHPHVDDIKKMLSEIRWRISENEWEKKRGGTFFPFEINLAK